jgi:hypothetical protein
MRWLLESNMLPFSHANLLESSGPSLLLTQPLN